MSSPFVVEPFVAEVPLPRMRMVRRRFPASPEVDVVDELDRQWATAGPRLGLRPGARVAVAVGSRGISDIDRLVRRVVHNLKQSGCEPFIVPAMGSHGGATAEGQTEVLAMLGITAASMGAPIRATMEVTPLGEADGIPLFIDRHAYEADGIVLVNRVKPHTDFVGLVESGPLKMLAVGLGKQVGADHYHRLGTVRDLGAIVLQAGRALLARTNVLFAVALVENHEHHPTILRVVPAAELEAAKLELLGVARACLPTLPLDEIDLLIVDRMGKDVSGSGLDPNVVGRASASWMAQRDRPRISRVFVRDLTPASVGNAIGLGMVDAVTTRLVDKIDIQATAVNALTSCAPEDGRIPLTFPCDRDAIVTLLTTIRPCTADEVRIVHVRDTCAVGRLLVSTGCLPALEGVPGAVVEPDDLELEFDSSGDLISRLSD